MKALARKLELELEKELNSFFYHHLRWREPGLASELEKEKESNWFFYYRLRWMEPGLQSIRKL